MPEASPYHRSRSAIVRRYERNRPFSRECARKEIGPRKAIHIAANRQPQVIKDGRGYIDDRAARTATSLDRPPVSEQEAVRSALVSARDAAIPKHFAEHLLQRGEPLHAEAADHQQQIIGPH